MSGERERETAGEGEQCEKYSSKSQFPLSVELNFKSCSAELANAKQALDGWLAGCIGTPSG